MNVVKRNLGSVSFAVEAVALSHESAEETSKLREWRIMRAYEVWIGQWDVVIQTRRSMARHPWILYGRLQRDAGGYRARHSGS